MFVRMLVVVADKTAFGRQRVLSMKTYPKSLAHCDGSPVFNIEISTLKKLDPIQTEQITDINALPNSYILVFGGGLLLHSVLSYANVESSFACISRSIYIVISDMFNEQRKDRTTK